MTRKTVIIYISALLFLTGCQADKADDPRQDGLVPVTLTASQGSILSISGGMTRAADGLYSASSGFSGTESVRVFMNPLLSPIGKHQPLCHLSRCISLIAHGDL